MSGSVLKRVFLIFFVCFFPFVKTSGYHLKVFVFKLNQIYICQGAIVEKHLRRYYVRINSMSKSKSWQSMVHFARGKNYKENIPKSIMWKRQRMQNVAFLKSLSII